MRALRLFKGSNFFTNPATAHFYLCSWTIKSGSRAFKTWHFKLFYAYAVVLVCKCKIFKYANIRHVSVNSDTARVLQFKITTRFIWYDEGKTIGSCYPWCYWFTHLTLRHKCESHQQTILYMIWLCVILCNDSTYDLCFILNPTLIFLWFFLDLMTWKMQMLTYVILLGCTIHTKYA